MENWKKIPSCPEYEASSEGRVRAIEGRYAVPRSAQKGSSNGHGYLAVTLKVGGRTVKRYVNRLVCEAFNGPAPTPRHQAAHLDGVRSNNLPDNLQWKTQAENEEDKALHGTRLSGERHPNAKLTKVKADAIRYERREWRSTLELLAAHHGVSTATVSLIINGKVW